MIYETKVDRLNEMRAAWIIEYAFDCYVEVTETSAPFDFKISRGGKPIAIGEYKHRKKKFDPYLVDRKKLDTIFKIAQQLKVKPMLFVQWGSGPLRWHQIRPPYGVQVMSRNNPRDQFDTDHCYEIPIKSFHAC